MRVLIQDCLNHKFLASPVKWVAKPDSATSFQKTLRAWVEIDRLALATIGFNDDDQPDRNDASNLRAFAADERSLAPSETRLTPLRD